MQQPLTDLELTVIVATAEGKSRKEMAFDERRALRSIDGRFYSIKRKLGYNSPVLLTRFAIRTGLFTEAIDFQI